MHDELLGTLQGRTITLDETVPTLEGHRVRVLLVADDEAPMELSRERHQELWQEWVQRGPQGPMEDDHGPELP